MSVFNLRTGSPLKLAGDFGAASGAGAQDAHRAPDSDHRVLLLLPASLRGTPEILWYMCRFVGDICTFLGEICTFLGDFWGIFGPIPGDEEEKAKR